MFHPVVMLSRSERSDSHEGTCSPLGAIYGSIDLRKTRRAFSPVSICEGEYSSRSWALVKNCVWHSLRNSASKFSALESTWSIKERESGA